MPIVNARRSSDVTYSIIHRVKPAGRSIGCFAGKDIPEAVEDDFGHILTYVGVAPRLQNGDYNVAALQPGEFIVKPGLIYCRVRQ